jgi:hypothetical protein
LLGHVLIGFQCFNVVRKKQIVCAYCRETDALYGDAFEVGAGCKSRHLDAL